MASSGSRTSSKREQVQAWSSDTNCELLEARFIDVLGHVKAMGIPLSRPTTNVREMASDEAVVRGISADGSSVAGYAEVQDSDLHLSPEGDTIFRLPYDERRAAAYCTVTGRGGGGPVAADPRFRLKNVLAEYLSSAQRIDIKPELELFLLDGKKPADAGAYLDVCPDNNLSEHLDDMFRALTGMGVPLERVHHECAPGQVEVEVDFGPILHQADRLVSAKLAIRTLAQRAGLRATFMPKPLVGMAGSGMHVHFRLFEGERNAFGAAEGKLSNTGRCFTAGLLEHAPALTAICNPSINSYKRLVPNHEAPVYITWGYRNRSSLVRIPLAATPAKTAVEFRSPDATANVHLALAAMVAAGMDGVRRKLEPPDDRPENVYQLTAVQRKRLKVRALPESLSEALDALERDPVIMGALGPVLGPKFLQLHREKWEEYLHGVVTDWEWQTYADA